jgi:hypothetical protein
MEQRFKSMSLFPEICNPQRFHTATVIFLHGYSDLSIDTHIMNTKTKGMSLLISPILQKALWISFLVKI